MLVASGEVFSVDVDSSIVKILKSFQKFPKKNFFFKKLFVSFCVKSFTRHMCQLESCHIDMTLHVWTV